MKIIFWILLYVFHATAAQATTRVAFFEAYDHTGAVIRLLPESKYFHVAIQIEDVWYHTDQDEGVTVLESFSDLGPQFQLKSILVNHDLYLQKSEIKPYLKMPFDLYYDWHDPNTTYCSKLIAKLLKVKPSLNLFKSSYWALAHGIKKGKEGISPDELYKKLLEKGFYKGWPVEFTPSSQKVCRSYFL